MMRGNVGKGKTYSVERRTWHVYHPAVAVLNNVACLTLYSTGGDAVHLEKARIQGSGHTLAPRRRKVGQLNKYKRVH